MAVTDIGSEKRLKDEFLAVQNEAILREARAWDAFLCMGLLRAGSDIFEEFHPKGDVSGDDWGKVLTQLAMEILEFRQQRQKEEAA